MNTELKSQYIELKARADAAYESAKPIRIQRSRAKGWEMPPNTVYVGRGSKWGNPFRVVHPGSAFEKPMYPAIAVASFRRMVEKEGSWTPVPLPWPKGKIPRQWTTVKEVGEELRGKNLACWCPLDQPCHADVLLELANAPVKP